MKFRYTIFYVENVAATLDFYVQAFDQQIAFLHESGDFGQLSTGETSLSFCSVALFRQLGKEPGQADPNRPVCEIAFETDDVAAALARAVGAGAGLVQDVRDEPWGQTTAYVRDPNGILVEICTPVVPPEQN